MSTINTTDLKLRIHNNGERFTIQTLLCELWKAKPNASNEEVVAAVLAEFPHSTYAEHRVQVDRRKYNKAAFKCQKGQIPEDPAVNPEKRPMQQSREVDTRQLELAL